MVRISFSLKTAVGCLAEKIDIRFYFCSIAVKLLARDDWIKENTGSY